MANFLGYDFRCCQAHRLYWYQGSRELGQFDHLIAKTIRFLDVATKPKKHKQTKFRTTILFAKKQVLVSFEPKTFVVTGVFVTSRLSVQKKLEFIISRGTNRSPNKSYERIFYRKKSLVTDCNIPAYCKGEKHMQMILHVHEIISQYCSKNFQ